MLGSQVLLTGRVLGLGVDTFDVILNTLDGEVIVRLDNEMLKSPDEFCQGIWEKRYGFKVKEVK